MKLASTARQIPPRDHEPGGACYSADDLAAIISVPIDRVSQWISHGLLEPASRNGSPRFDFQQLTIAKTLSEMVESGATLKKLRRSIKRLRQWLPPSTAKQAAPHFNAGDVYIRLTEGELAQSDGQLCLEFSEDELAHKPLSLSIERSPRQWYELGLSSEVDGDLAGAIDAYRMALQVGGPDVEICFALAHALGETGQHAPAAERYRQVIELDPQNSDAWNNLGVALCATGDHHAAFAALRRAIRLTPDDPRPHYNLADALDEKGYVDEAAKHWQTYLRHDIASPRAAHARKRLAAM